MLPEALADFDVRREPPTLSGRTGEERTSSPCLVRADGPECILDLRSYPDGIRPVTPVPGTAPALDVKYYGRLPDRSFPVLDDASQLVCFLCAWGRGEATIIRAAVYGTNPAMIARWWLRPSDAMERLYRAFELSTLTDAVIAVGLRQAEQGIHHQYLGRKVLACAGQFILDGEDAAVPAGLASETGAATAAIAASDGTSLEASPGDGHSPRRQPAAPEISPQRAVLAAEQASPEADPLSTRRRPARTCLTRWMCRIG